MYQKLMNRELKYTVIFTSSSIFLIWALQAVLGKPTEVSYLHATHCLQDMATEMAQVPPKTVYVIGLVLKLNETAFYPSDFYQ